MDIDHWKKFWARFWQTHKRQIILMIEEIKDNLDKALFPWDPRNWSRKVMERHWAVFEIEKLVEKDGGRLLHQTLLKTWEKTMGHRLDALAIKSDPREILRD